MLKQTLLTSLLIAATCLPMTSCATVVGTLVSPVTGGVDLARRESGGDVFMAPVYFLAGMISGPFVSMYNGLTYDISIFRSFGGYWLNFGGVFRPFELLSKQ